MHDALHQHRFSKLLKQSSQKLDLLLDEIRPFEPQLIPLELLDEIASTIGELTLVLSDHLALDQNQELAHRVVVLAHRLHKDVRSQQLPKEQIALAVGSLTQELNRLLLEDKRAA